MSERLDAVNLWELEARAREVLPQMAYDYYASGANDEVTLQGGRIDSRYADPRKARA